MRQPVELLYLARMLKWQKSAPPDGRQGLLDGEAERNTQISRMAYVLSDIAIGTQDRVFRSLERDTSRQDGRSYISKDSSWMKEPYPLLDGWYFEGCTSLVQKHGILENLISLGLSRAFVSCAKDFVEGKDIAKHLPSEEEQLRIVREHEEREKRQVSA